MAVSGAGGAATTAKLVLTLFAADMVTVQVGLVPEQAPPQPPKVLPVLGDSVRVTEVPELKLAEQVPGQLIPEPVIVPEPLTLVVRVYWVGGGGAETVKLDETLLSAFI